MPDAIEVLAAHQLGVMGTCVDARGLPSCDWKAKRPVERHGRFDAQHRAHQAAALREAGIGDLARAWDEGGAAAVEYHMGRARSWRNRNPYRKGGGGE